MNGAELWPLPQSGCSSTVVKILPGVEGLPKQTSLCSRPASQPVLALARSPAFLTACGAWPALPSSGWPFPQATLMATGLRGIC